VFRRGPVNAVCTVGWNRKTDEFQLGQWLRGRIYERRADLSPDGRHLIYFARGGRRHPSVRQRLGELGAWRHAAINLRLANATTRIHTPTMTLKGAAVLAFLGSLLVAALFVYDFVFSVLNVIRGLIPAVTMFLSLIYAFGAVSVTLFFYVFHKHQS
jgi:hypothetical protein